MKMYTDLKDYIKIYDNAFSGSLCERIINKSQSVSPTDRFNTSLYKFDQWNLIDLQEHFVQELHDINSIFDFYVEKYQSDIKLDFLPQRYGMEAYKLKQYQSDGYFYQHTDANNKTNCIRFLSLFVYLNGGSGTKFPFFESQPKTGSMIVFPPMWMYPHTASVSSNKMILHTYLHYVAP